MDTISGSCRAGSRLPDKVSGTISAPPLIGGLEMLVLTAGDRKRDPRPARILLPVALFPVPAWVQPKIFQDEFPRL